jgi:ketosteroid isomerase-like protein
MNETLGQFMRDYETATNSHDFEKVVPLLSPTAVYWFSDGSFIGIEAIRKAFIETWGKIQNETYSLHNIQWIAANEELAICIYEFHWEGLVDGQLWSGKGRGTNVVGQEDGQWKMLHEHLSKHP